MRFFRILSISLFLALLGSVILAVGGFFILYAFGRNLPDYRTLADYRPPVMTRVHAGDGRLLAEFAIEKRVFVPINAIPRRVKNAFLSAEDRHFYRHIGINPISILRAIVTNVKNFSKNQRLIGASTITQQVAKNFLLTNKISFKRKVKEAILALRIERVLSKERILELYLNKIYLGFNSYGVATAALNYFNKSMDELTIAEIALLAALPKAPNNYNPIKNPQAAKKRRNWVIGRMVEDGHVSPAQGADAQNEPIIIHNRKAVEFVRADYFTEEVRRWLVNEYGKEALYKEGLLVRTTLDPRLQEIAQRALHHGTENYDRRHGYRGPLTRLMNKGVTRLPENWRDRLAQVTLPQGLPVDWRIAAVTAVNKKFARLEFNEEIGGVLPLSGMLWARKPLQEGEIGPELTRVSDVLKKGDVIIVVPIHEGTDLQEQTASYLQNRYALCQIPEIQGAIVALDPHTGRVLAMSGGFSFEQSEFNRATQAMRQPGSAFKPFVYLAALDSGFTPSSIILDAPFVIEQGPGQPKWRPGNYTKKFYGPSTLRLGLEKSRNLMTVRLAQAIGMEKIATYAEKFGVVDNLKKTLAMSLGAAETTLMRLTTGYAMFVNGGKYIYPTLIDRIQNRNGKTIYRHDTRDCADCLAEFWRHQPVPKVLDVREQIADPASVYQIVSMLRGAVLRGTGWRIASLGRPLAGKTGTTNASIDAWFIGFSPDLAVGVFMGFDDPRTLGKEETGSSVAAPVFKSFMKEALQNQPTIPFRVPKGIDLVRIDAITGLPAQVGAHNIILEAYKPGTEPKEGERPLGTTFGSGVGESGTEVEGLY